MVSKPIKIESSQKVASDAKAPEGSALQSSRRKILALGFYPVRKPLCLPCTPCGAGLVAGMKRIPSSANPVRDLSLNGASIGFNAPSEPFR